MLRKIHLERTCIKKGDRIKLVNVSSKKNFYIWAQKVKTDKIKNEKKILKDENWRGRVKFKS